MHLSAFRHACNIVSLCIILIITIIIIVVILVKPSYYKDNFNSPRRTASNCAESLPTLFSATILNRPTLSMRARRTVNVEWVLSPSTDVPFARLTGSSFRYHVTFGAGMPYRLASRMRALPAFTCCLPWYLGSTSILGATARSRTMHRLIASRLLYTCICHRGFCVSEDLT